jgi:predicted nuclease with TOPRIM domain
LNLELEQTIEDYKSRTEIVAQGSSELQSMLLEKDAQIKKFLNETKALKEERKGLQTTLGQQVKEVQDLQSRIQELDGDISNQKNSLRSNDEQLNQTIEE